MDEICPGVFVGGYLAAADGANIRKHKITRIVKMFADSKDYPGGYHSHPDVSYHVVNADDTPEYRMDKVAPDAVMFVDEGREKGENVLIHCHAGVSRSSTIAIAYLVACGMALKDALALAQKKRPCIQPNTGFMKYLEQCDKRREMVLDKK
jgi:predicted protein tyrosine phosphatase